MKYEKMKKEYSFANGSGEILQKNCAGGIHSLFHSPVIFSKGKYFLFND